MQDQYDKKLSCKLMLIGQRLGDICQIEIEPLVKKNFQGTDMKNIVIYAPYKAVAMSLMLIKDLCWVAASIASGNENNGAQGRGSVTIINKSGETVACFNESEVISDGTIGSNSRPDLVFIAAFWGQAGDALEYHPELLPWLRQLHDSGCPLVAISNAAYFLAQAGLLENKVATLYPPYERDFRQRYPNVQLRQERAITNAGGLYCANAIPSGCDLCISMLEQIYGPEVARKVAARFLIGFNRSYAQWNVEFDGLKYHKDQQVLTAQQWLERHYSDDVNFAEVAADLGMSSRNFSRRFSQATGEAPNQYLQRVRIEAAKELLRTTDLKVIEVANQVGASNLSSFNKIFKKVVEMPPKEYRAKHEK